MITKEKQDVTVDVKPAPDYGLVSIIMPNYNAAIYLEETVNSVLAQTYPHWELLFVDDCSTDGSMDRIRAFDDKRIRVLCNKTNSGAAVSRNYALQEAKGKWVAFLDSDDCWQPEKLMEQLKFMIENDCHFSYTTYSRMDEESRPNKGEITGPRRISKRKMFQYDYVGCLTVMYDREYVGLVQANPSLRCRNDYALWLKVCKHCDCLLLDKNLATYRIRKNSLSHSGLGQKMYNQYRLFRCGEGMNAVCAGWHTLVNFMFGVLKKLLYVR